MNEAKVSGCDRKLTKPCKSCPFSRKVEPGMTGGSDPLVYVGQSQGPYLLNCHCGPGYEIPENRGELGMTQCAGAAIYRANLGLGHVGPEVLLRLPPDHELVFSSHAEFVAHHARVSVLAVEMTFEDIPPERFLVAELEKIQPHMLRRV